MNKIFITGRLTRAPEMRVTKSGHSVCNISVAANHGFGDRKATNFYNVSVWGKQAEACQQYLTKGQEVKVVGDLSLRMYDKKDGGQGASLDVHAQDVEFGTRSEGAPEGGYASPNTYGNAPAGMTRIEDDSLPF